MSTTLPSWVRVVLATYRLGVFGLHSFGLSTRNVWEVVAFSPALMVTWVSVLPTEPTYFTPVASTGKMVVVRVADASDFELFSLSIRMLTEAESAETLGVVT